MENDDYYEGRPCNECGSTKTKLESVFIPLMWAFVKCEDCGYTVCCMGGLKTPDA